jgi:hypothetical protein
MTGPLKNPERKSNNDPEYFENALDGDAHQFEGQKQNPD